ncbi:MAG TPA: TetR/AcrR family transcriptional regulator [Puia sp.]|jgi:TetR/AcrR family transcriptional repressor of multidrug resistance operon|nr:TetR/AcrR family transcriptional regulator [Puia sp.]
MRPRDIHKENLVKSKAIELIVKEGLEGFSMNKLARACKISVNTLYIYYKDRDDLIVKIAREEGKRMSDMMLAAFDPNAAFEEGLRVQWKIRFEYLKDKPLLKSFFDQLQSSTYQEQIADSLNEFTAAVTLFMKNVIARGEMVDVPAEVYWSVGLAPLYSLINFHHKKRGLKGRAFEVNATILWTTFDLVAKALKK